MAKCRLSGKGDRKRLHFDQVGQKEIPRNGINFTGGGWVLFAIPVVGASSVKTTASPPQFV